MNKGSLTSREDAAKNDYSLSVVVPAFNEEGNIRQAIDEIIAGLPDQVKEYEVIVIDDGSKDATSDILRELTAHNKNVFGIFNQKNRGKGAALISGFKLARMDWILFMDADMQVDIRELSKFLKYMESCDVILGYRQVHGASLVRRFFSKGYALLIRWLLRVKLKDINCPFKLIKRSVVNSLKLKSCGFFIDAELLSMAISRGCVIKELGVTGRRRRHGKSTIRFRHVLETIGELLSFLQDK